jgi:hypothetical protein
LFAGHTGTGVMALLLAKMPWNRGENCGSHCEAKIKPAVKLP